MEPEDNDLPLTCWECGSAIIEDESPGVYRHLDTEECSGHDIDADHVALPPLEDF